MPKLTVSRTLARICAMAATLVLVAVSMAAAQDRPTVVAVNYALSYFAQTLGGDDVDVLFPVPGDVDPSFWRPGVSDISTMQRADLILLNGAGFATWIDKASLPRSRMVVTSRAFEDRYIQTETITHSHGEGGEHAHTGTASYTWLDQEKALMQARAIAEAYAQQGLVAADVLDARLGELSDILMALDEKGARLRPLAQGKVLIATHPRYQYLARAYGLDIRALEWEAGTAPDADQLAELDTILAQSEAQVLLWEARPPDAARAAIRARGLDDVVFPPLSRSPDGSDYAETLSAALDALAEALSR